VLDWQSYAIALAVLVLLMLLLRWAHGGRSRSLVERLPQAGPADDYGLMVSIASPGSYAAGEVSRRRLLDAGIRASLVATTEGPRLMVFREDEQQARRLLAT